MNTKPGGNMGNGERDNALRDRIEEYTPSEPLYRSPIDLCVCGPATRATYGCECGNTNSPEETILQEADRLTRHPRGKAYGHPYDDFTKVTNMALALWGRGPEKPEEHALYQILVKLARLEATPGHHDSIVDIAGYAKAYSMVIEERVRRLTA